MDTTNTTILNPRELYRSFGSLSLDELRQKVGELLSRGITVTCGDEPVHFQTSYLIKSGKFKDIYMLSQISIGEGDASRVYEPDDYILKVRFMNNTDEYWSNESMTFPDRGLIPLEMSEGHRYSLISGEIAQLFARIIPLKSYILMQTHKYVVDFIIQERMTTSLDILRRNAQLSPSMIFCFMYRMLEMVRILTNMNYTFTNFSPSSVMLKASKEGWSLKLMNLSFLQRDGDIQIGTNDKLLVTASLNQLRGDVSSSKSNMMWNVIFTVFDLFRPKSYLWHIRSCCMNDECVLTKLYNNRRAEINQYMSNKGDNEAIVTIQRILNAVRTNNPLPEMMSILEGYNSSSNRIIHDLVLTLIARKMLFNDPGDANYESMNPFRPSCNWTDKDINNMVSVDDTIDDTIDGIRNLTGNNDSDYYYPGTTTRTRKIQTNDDNGIPSATVDGIRNLTGNNDSNYYYPSSATSIDGIRNLTGNNDSNYYYQSNENNNNTTTAVARSRSNSRSNSSIGSIGDLENTSSIDGIRNLTGNNDSDYYYPSSATTIDGIRNLTGNNDSNYYYQSNENNNNNNTTTAVRSRSNSRSNSSIGSIGDLENTTVDGIRNLTGNNDSDYYYPSSATTVDGIRNLTGNNDSDYYYPGTTTRTRKIQTNNTNSNSSIGNIGDLENTTVDGIRNLTGNNDSDYYYPSSATTIDGIRNLTGNNDSDYYYPSSYTQPQFTKPPFNQTVFGGASTRDILHMLDRRIRKLEKKNQ